MSEQDYERMVTKLEEQHHNSIAATARSTYFNSLQNGLSDTDAAENARQAAFEDLIADSRWEAVEAQDIRDIADDIACDVVHEEHEITHGG